MFERLLGAIMKLYLALGGGLDMGLICAIGMKKWKNSEIKGTWTVEYSRFMGDVNMSRGE
jgi:hypothetical protein